MDDNTLGILQTLNAQFIQNFVSCDVQAHDTIIHDRFICLAPDGGRLNREAYLEYWATAFDPDSFVYFDYRDETIDVFGNTALVRSATKFVRRTNGSEQTGMNIYTDTYLEENGVWKCIQAHLTPLAPAHYPGDSTIVRAWVHGRPQSA